MDVVNVQFYAGYVEVRFCDSDERIRTKLIPTLASGLDEAEFQILTLYSESPLEYISRKKVGDRTLDIETSKVVGLKQLEGNIEEILH